MTPSQDTDTPTPQAVDYSGRPLHEGDTVAFLTYDPIGLCEGRIRIIGPNDLCIDTGHNLVTFPAAQKFAGNFRIRPVGGTVEPRPIPDGAQQYPQVALQPSEDSGSVTVHVGTIDDVVYRDVARRLDRDVRAQRDGA